MARPHLHDRNMETKSVRKYLEKGTDGGKNSSLIDGLPFKFFERFIMAGIHVDLAEPGRVLCSMKVPPRLVDPGNFLHGGVTATLVDIVGAAAISTATGDENSGVSMEINISYMDAAYVGEEIEMEAKSLRVGKVIAVANVELVRKKLVKL